jgi:hypothetical protein
LCVAVQPGKGPGAQQSLSLVYTPPGAHTAAARVGPQAAPPQRYSTVPSFTSIRVFHRAPRVKEGARALHDRHRPCLAATSSNELFAKAEVPLRQWRLRAAPCGWRDRGHCCWRRATAAAAALHARRRCVLPAPSCCLLCALPSPACSKAQRSPKSPAPRCHRRVPSRFNPGPLPGAGAARSSGGAAASLPLASLSLGQSRSGDGRAAANPLFVLSALWDWGSDSSAPGSGEGAGSGGGDDTTSSGESDATMTEGEIQFLQRCGLWEVFTGPRMRLQLNAAQVGAEDGRGRRPSTAASSALRGAPLHTCVPAAPPSTGCSAPP